MNIPGVKEEARDPFAARAGGGAAVPKNLVIVLLERKDFPLLEILMAAAILSLSWLLFVGGVFASGGRKLAAINHQRMILLGMALQSYKWANNSFPPALEALVCEDRGKSLCIPVAAEELLADVWGAPYIYRPSETGFTLESLGADGKEGGSGPDSDIKHNGP